MLSSINRMENCEINFKDVYGRYFDLLHLCDIRIVANDKRSFDGHKVILANGSDYFKGMFSGFDKDKKEYRFSNINGKTLADIFTFIYTKNIPITETNIKDLLTASHFFLMKDLYARVKESVRNVITFYNCLELLKAAYQINDNEVLDYSLLLIVRNFKYITLLNFEQLPLEVLKLILSNSKLNVQNENIVWQIIVRWVKADQSRLEYVTSLLSALAFCEIDENLATEILNHDVVMNNIHMEEMRNIASHSGCNNSREVLANFLADFKPKEFRIPQKLNIIAQCINERNTKLFVSYDETHHLWREIYYIEDFAPFEIIAAGSNVFIFEHTLRKICLNLNLKTMKIKQLANSFYNNNTFFLAIKNSLYTLYYARGWYHIAKFDPENSYIFPIASLNKPNFTQAFAAVLQENIFLIAVNEVSEYRMTQMFNVVTKQWTILPSPQCFDQGLKLIEHHNKIYLVDIKKVQPRVEVFEPATNVWKMLPALKQTAYEMDVGIINDRLTIYGNASLYRECKQDPINVAWDEIKEDWEILKEGSLPKDMICYQMCCVTDNETIKILTKQNRDSDVHMEKSPFYW